MKKSKTFLRTKKRIDLRLKSRMGALPPYPRCLYAFGLPVKHKTANQRPAVSPYNP